MLSPMHTRRLLLRPFERNDAPAAFGWSGDPAVMRFNATPADTSIAETQKRIARYMAHQAEHGFSKWILVEQATGRAIGNAGLIHLRDYGWIDLGFRLAQPHWGQGLATEAAQAWVSAAFEELGMKRLGAFVHPENTASIHVLEKLGFARGHSATILGMSSIQFSLEAPSPKTQRAPR